MRCRKGMRVLPDVSFADHPPLDVVVVPGGEGTLLHALQQLISPDHLHFRFVAHV